MRKLGFTIALLLLLAPVVSAEPFTDFVIFGGQSTSVGPFTTVNSGDVGSNGPVTTSAFSSFPPDSIIPNAGVTIPAADSFTAGGNNVTNFGSASNPITPGSYNALTFTAPNNFPGSPTNLYLTAGNYYFNNIDLTANFFNHVILNLENVTPTDGVHIFVTGDVNLNGEVDFTLNGAVPSQANSDLAGDILIETLGNFHESNPFLQGFAGTIFAPNGDVTLDASVSSPTFTGSIIAGGNASTGAFFTFDDAPSSYLASVPEPHSIVLLGLALPGLLGYGWRRKRMA